MIVVFKIMNLDINPDNILFIMSHNRETRGHNFKRLNKQGAEFQ